MNAAENIVKDTIASSSAYLIGVDGGGTGTRVVLADANGVELARGAGGPSGLVHGRQHAWNSILVAIGQAFEHAGRTLPTLSSMAIGCGLAGVNNVQWAAEFVALNPGFATVVAETDAYTTLLGAHLGQPGVVIALGTGSVGEVLQANGQRREVGGWGFPASDEASGAWLGLHAVNHLQRTLDGRAPANPFSVAVLAHCGGDKNAVFSWLASANQTRYAELAPIVVRFAAENNVAQQIMLDAGKEVQAMAYALDASGELPIALCGGLAAAVAHYLPEELQQKAQKPQGDSAHGALIMIQHHLQKN
ncbi:BadF/BadG/BcrA/BcrD ATPase family protein [Undibacterium sp. RuRC25W]|uniref:BadF/BadG/BcrA/BcrD ATPase family protein n=1 Tax=Undibacterium sp. RuRC25W TaxID=3413047 RepID=UPI003BF26C52